MLLRAPYLPCSGRRRSRPVQHDLVCTGRNDERRGRRRRMRRVQPAIVRVNGRLERIEQRIPRRHEPLVLRHLLVGVDDAVAVRVEFDGQVVVAVPRRTPVHIPGKFVRSTNMPGRLVAEPGSGLRNDNLHFVSMRYVVRAVGEREAPSPGARAPVGIARLIGEIGIGVIRRIGGEAHHKARLGRPGAPRAVRIPGPRDAAGRRRRGAALEPVVLLQHEVPLVVRRLAGQLAVIGIKVRHHGGLPRIVGPGFSCGMRFRIRMDGHDAREIRAAEPAEGVRRESPLMVGPERIPQRVHQVSCRLDISEPRKRSAHIHAVIVQSVAYRIVHGVLSPSYAACAIVPRAREPGARGTFEERNVHAFQIVLHFDLGVSILISRIREGVLNDVVVVVILVAPRHGAPVRRDPDGGIDLRNHHAVRRHAAVHFVRHHRLKERVRAVHLHRHGFVSGIQQMRYAEHFSDAGRARPCVGDADVVLLPGFPMSHVLRANPEPFPAAVPRSRTNGRVIPDHVAALGVGPAGQVPALEVAYAKPLGDPLSLCVLYRRKEHQRQRQSGSRKP